MDANGAEEYILINLRVWSECGNLTLTDASTDGVHMKTHIEMLKEMGVADGDAEQYLPHLEDALPKHGIADSRLRLAHFFSQVLHESGCMRFDMENLNYSSDALQRVFGKYFKTKDDADGCARQPEKIANRVYAGRMGNGPHWRQPAAEPVGEAEAEQGRDGAHAKTAGWLHGWGPVTREWISFHEAEHYR